MGDARIPNSFPGGPRSPSAIHEAKTFLAPDRNDPMSFEQKRLESFRNWPEAAPIEKNKLAKAGFYYSGSGLSVTCFSCKIIVDNWDFNQTAIVRHKNLNPQCDFIMNKSSNVPLNAREGSLSSPPSSINLSQQPPSDSSSSADANPTPLMIRSQSVTTMQSGSFNDHAQQLNITAVEHESDLRNQKTWRSFSLLLHEKERLKTFKGWSVPFVSPHDLARTGFFFLRDRDRVQCVYCNGIVGDWEHGDVPSTEHHRHFPNCPLLKGYDVGNVPIDRTQSSHNSVYDQLSPGRPGQPEDVTGMRWQSQSQMCNGPEKGHNTRPGQNTCSGNLGITRHTGPKHPNYATIEARLRTYMNWPVSIPQNPQVLAAAGFYYAGISDHVRCFYCDGGLRNWEPEDDPWTEHARWFGNCSFLLLVKGYEFANEAKVLRPPVLPEDELSRSSQVPPVEQPSVALARQLSINSLMHSPIVKAVLEAGIPTELVREALEKQLQQTGTPFTDANELYDACMVIENRVERRFPNNHTEEAMSIGHSETPAIHSPITVCNGTTPLSPTASLSPTMELETKTKELALEDTNSMKETRVCKICMDEELGVVFLPCGHLIACVKCAPSLTDCPYCRKTIRGTVRTYFS